MGKTLYPFPDKFWYSTNTRFYICLIVGIIHLLIILFLCFCTFKFFLYRKFNFVRKRHPKIMIIWSILNFTAIIDSYMRLCTLLNIFFRYDYAYVALQFVVVFYTTIILNIWRGWILRFDMVYQRLERNDSWKKELLGEDYICVDSKYTRMLIKHRNLFGNPKKITIVMLAIHFTILAPFTFIAIKFPVYFSFSAFVYLGSMAIMSVYWFRKFPSYEDSIGLGQEATVMKKIILLFLFYPLSTGLYVFGLIPDEIHRTVLCLLVTAAFSASQYIGTYRILIMNRETIQKSSGLHRNRNDSRNVSGGKFTSFFKNKPIDTSDEDYKIFVKYNLEKVTSDNALFVLFTRHCIMELCVENLLFLFKVMQYKMCFAKYLMLDIDTDEEYEEVFGYRLLFPRKILEIARLHTARQQFLLSVDENPEIQQQPSIIMEHSDKKFTVLQKQTSVVTMKKGKNNKVKFTAHHLRNEKSMSRSIEIDLNAEFSLLQTPTQRTKAGGNKKLGIFRFDSEPTMESVRSQTHDIVYQRQKEQRPSYICITFFIDFVSLFVLDAILRVLSSSRKSNPGKDRYVVDSDPELSATLDAADTTPVVERHKSDAQSTPTVLDLMDMSSGRSEPFPQQLSLTELQSQNTVSLDAGQAHHHIKQSSDLFIEIKEDEEIDIDIHGEVVAEAPTIIILDDGVCSSSEESVDGKVRVEVGRPRMASPRTMYRLSKRFFGGKIELDYDPLQLERDMITFAFDIYHEFCKTGANQEINISGRLRRDMCKAFEPHLLFRDEEIADNFHIKNMELCDKFQLFDYAADQIHHMMKTDTFARFKRSKEFMVYAHEQTKLENKPSLLKMINSSNSDLSKKRENSKSAKSKTEMSGSVFSYTGHF